MKKIFFKGLFFLVLPSLSFAAANSQKNDVSVPYYNGGFNFGLASYHCKTKVNSTKNDSERENKVDVGGNENKPSIHQQI